MGKWDDGARLTDEFDQPLIAQAVDVSADGSLIIGTLIASSGAKDQGFIWRDGLPIARLGFLPGDDFSEAEGISADGHVVVGWSGSSTDPTNYPIAVRWIDGDIEPLGDLPGHSDTYARGVSFDGSVVIGNAISPERTRSDVFIWDEGRGMRELRQVLAVELGLDLTGWKLDEAFGVSGDGLTIVGNGTNPEGLQEAWLAVIPEPHTALLVMAGLVGIAACKHRSSCRPTRVTYPMCRLSSHQKCLPNV